VLSLIQCFVLLEGVQSRGGGEYGRSSSVAPLWCDRGDDEEEDEDEDEEDDDDDDMEDLSTFANAYIARKSVVTEASPAYIEVVTLLPS
tara:strand:- start:372 stop:638 length:267 start_codon:yes stop_codon:yes gene_type:complete